MRIWTYIKSLNKTLRTNITSVAVFIVLAGIYVNNAYKSKEDVWEGMNQSDNIGNIECVISFWNRIEKEKILATFDQYKIDEIFTDKIAPLDLDSNYIARRFKTNINNSLKNGINFAGHYVVAEWGFTGIGSMLAVIDATNGKAYPFLYVAKHNFEYRPDSNLLILNYLKRPQEIKEETSDWLCSQYMTDVRPYYFLWEDNTFRFLGPKDGLAPNEDDNGWMHP